MNPGDLYNPWRIFVGCIVPNVITRRTDLSPTAKLIFGKLCQFAGENGQAYPSYGTLAKEVGVERRQAMRGVKELVDFGLIRPEGRVKENGAYTSNIYVFLWHRIFFSDDSTCPDVKNDTRGDVTKDTTPRCHPRHQVVSDMTPKENHTRESNSEETTTKQIRLLLSGTSFSGISDHELFVLIKCHGSERVTLTADIAAETWRRDRKEIRNPCGYLHALCESHSVPEWYEPPDVRVAKSEVIAKQRHAKELRQIEGKAAEEREAQERNHFWDSLSEEERQKFRDDFRESSLFLKESSDHIVDNLAKLAAWENRSQMHTKGNLISEPVS